jgi:hypothetical protein
MVMNIHDLSRLIKLALQRQADHAKDTSLLHQVFFVLNFICYPYNIGNDSIGHLTISIGKFVI